jgi:hypothetical protein
MTSGSDTRMVGALLFLVISSVAAGCFAEDECGAVDDEMCISGSRHSCSYSSGAYRLHDTGQSCSLFGAGGQAAPSEPLSRCAANEPSRCEGEVSVDCTPASGFAGTRVDCATGDDPRVCVVDDNGVAFCAASRERDAQCEALGGWETFCDGHMLIACRAGFAEEITPCPGSCVSPDGQGGFCVLGTGPDARCADVAPGELRDFCEGSLRISCSEGYAWVSADCGSLGKECELSDGGYGVCW